MYLWSNTRPKHVVKLLRPVAAIVTADVIVNVAATASARAIVSAFVNALFTELKNMKTLNTTLTFGFRYITDPYRIELFKLIEIQKISGMNRARTEKTRREALEAQLHTLGMTLDEYKELEVKSKEPFYHNGAGNIFIPNMSVSACLVNANDVAPRKMRIENLRIAVRISDFETEKKKSDGVWERFVVVKSGSGRQLSNQRGLRTSSYLENFKAAGTLTVDEQMVNPQAVVSLLEFAGRVVGIGASRKMGYGRFTVSSN